MREIEVTQAQSNQRLDQFCASMSEYSRSKVSQMIKQGDILVNNEIM